MKKSSKVKNFFNPVPHISPAVKLLELPLIIFLALYRFFMENLWYKYWLPEILSLYEKTKAEIKKKMEDKK